MMNTQETKLTIEIMANFGKACETNNLQLVKDILASEGHILMDEDKYDSGFISACGDGAVDVAQYLYNYATPKEYSLKEAFKSACDMSKIDSIKFLVLETTLVRKDVQEYITEVKGYDQDFYQEIQQVFRDKMSMLEAEAYMHAE
jgi:hypothetical protein